MSTSMSKLSKPPQESWLTKQQAAQILGVAEKTIDRMAKAGELQKEVLKRPRQVPIAVFHPGDVERARMARGPRAYVMPETVQQVSGMGDRQVSNLSVPPRPLWLTLREAVIYSGLPASVLLEFIAGGRLLALDVGRRRRGGRWRIRKVDLRNLEAQSSDHLLPQP